ncbi:hypothetical protein B0A50_03112 [Salinomyces thailandicus]|uniref:Zinc/iron permease n=1 Tax=Salinomyces thailandicus TaxID=706561 RepID=A0A4V5N552_9PEZI|nr:hypothetical protein B0A50_03112 [Salinomyces thailandica]
MSEERERKFDEMHDVMQIGNGPSTALAGRPLTAVGLTIKAAPCRNEKARMPLSNDERGWVMTILSGFACVLGASVICIDIIVRQFPGKKNFRIQDSDSFLSASLSLSFGVMLFSALYTNAFLSIGLQTSIAIALHKLPEGFITYATNHANPRLGFSVFLALFIHNITEGFAMALPLYLAINNRFRAMLISFVLGGLSQPIGAGVAALWFKIAGHGDWAPSEGVYGAMFAVTAGIMASVALQLFSESLDLTHSRTLCMVGAFSGMAILGISSALTA